MTTDEILSMPAGREMDAAVAEAMGFQNVRAAPSVFKFVRDPTTEEHEVYKASGVRHAFLPVESYSTDIRAAWMCVDWLVARYPDQDFHLEHMEHEGWGVGSCHWDECVLGETAPLAVCRAVLLEAMKDNEPNKES